MGAPVGGLMGLRVKEIFRTIQGEGSRAGSPAIFVRLAGCNLWSGNPEKREGFGECAKWCDTDFVGGERMDPGLAVEQVVALAEGMRNPLIVLTGGEPALQLRRRHGEVFVNELHVALECEVAIETNGSVEADILDALDHVTVSPKPLMGDAATIGHIVVRNGDDLKVIVPTTLPLHEMAGWNFKHRFLQPMDRGDTGSAALPMTMKLAASLGWRVSVQTHKMLGLP